MNSEVDYMETELNLDDPSMDDYGDPMESIYRGLSPWELNNLPDVHHSPNHTVLYNMPLSADVKNPPKPFRGPDKWDALHVRLPCSPKNQYPVSNPDGTEDIKSRWALIVETLDRDITSSQDLEAAILTYNTKYNRTWKFRGLHALCEEMDVEGREFLFDVTVPGIIRLALQLPEVLPSAVPLLKSGRTASISFSQQQISCLLANAFLCTFPRRNTQKRNSEYRSFPDINFNRLFQSTNRSVLEKLKCILHYFVRVSTKVPTGVVTIARRCWDGPNPPPIRWSECTANFCHTRLHVSSAGTIEDQGVGLLQVDFANKYLGGGVLGQGCVQEEIRFVICPELFVTKLVAEVMQPHEALFMVGCERYSAYSGYASSFSFAGEFIDDTPFDASRRRCCSIVAIDALNFHTASDQYRDDLMHRELDKAHVGYGPWMSTPAPGVATGNWGCGAFGGDKRLKAILQLIVCCVVSRPLVYYTFGDRALARDLLGVFEFLKKERISVGKLWSYLKQFRFQKLSGEKLFPFIYQAFQDEQSNSRKLPPKNPANCADSPIAKHTETQACKPSTSSDSISNAEQKLSFTWPNAKKKTLPCAGSESPRKMNNNQPSKSQPSGPRPASLLLASLDASYSNQNNPISSTNTSADQAHHSQSDPQSSSVLRPTSLLLASLDADYCNQSQLNTSLSTKETDVWKSSESKCHDRSFTDDMVNNTSSKDTSNYTLSTNDAQAILKGSIVIRSNDNINAHSEDALCEVLSEDPPIVPTPPKLSKNGLSYPPTAFGATTPTVEIDTDDSSVISATPTPPERRRFVPTGSNHKRQSKISDFLKEK